MAKMLKCTINGVALEVPEGSTIIEAFHSGEQAIAHYCWHPALSIAGVCRLCMVEIQGNPKLQIACNTMVTEGMVINNASEKVKESVRWGLDFHLINHPLDCPICDQAGECGLQDQYMEYGKYTPEMAERKVKKHKVVDLGPRVVLDSERCILCSRCVRFTDEVSKTHELGIFNRGDRAEIGTFDGKPLNNNYSLNTVDICPVGALTSKDFRFRQRVWLLKDFSTICTGCSTGCSIRLYYNKEGLFRAKPEYDPETNGYWMCDEGRDVYKFVNKPSRQLDARKISSGIVEHMSSLEAAKKAGEWLKQSSATALVVTGQASCEELESSVEYFKTDLKSDKIYHWINNPEKMNEFDGLLNRGDKNPNTKGVEEVLARHSIKTAWSDLESVLNIGKIDTLLVVAPENQSVYPDLLNKINLFKKAKKIIWCGAGKVVELDSVTELLQIPLLSYVEKEGSYLNQAGKKRSLRREMDIVPTAISMSEAVDIMTGKISSLPRLMPPPPASNPGPSLTRIQNEFTRQRGSL